MMVKNVIFYSVLGVLFIICLGLYVQASTTEHEYIGTILTIKNSFGGHDGWTPIITISFTSGKVLTFDAQYSEVLTAYIGKQIHLTYTNPDGPLLISKIEVVR